MLQAQIELRLVEKDFKRGTKAWYLRLLGKLIVTSTWLLNCLKDKDKPW